MYLKNEKKIETYISSKDGLTIEFYTELAIVDSGRIDLNILN